MSLFSWGQNDQGQLGVGIKEDKLDPVTVEGLPGEIVDLAAGDRHTLAVTELGDVYVWGRGREGQHGNGKRHHITLAPVRVAALDSERVAKVVAGTRHCVAITHEGNVYLWGMLHRFQERSAIEYFGEKVDLPGMSKKASAPQPEEGSDWERKRAEMLEQSHRSYYSAGAVEESSKDGQSRELSNFGQFQALFQTTPLPLSSLNGKVRIVGGAAGYSFTFLITSEGDVYGFGFNEKRQLGLGHRYNLETPQVNKTLKAAGAKVVKITCGQQHVLALTSEGHVWSWGLGVFGQLGHGETHDEGLPRRIEAFKEMCIVDIGCGANHSLALDDQGRVFSWGSSEYGQQGGRNEYTDWEQGAAHASGKRKYYYSEPRLLAESWDGKKVVRIACGNLHNVALTEEGDVYSWGWGIQGALGHGNRNFQHVPRVLAKLRGERLVLLVAGAHSNFVGTSGSSATFAFDFKGLLNKASYSDLTFKVQGKLIQAHQAIVFTRCLRFKQLAIVWWMQHPTSDPVEVDGVEYFVFLSLLKYLYTDHLQATPHHVPKLLQMAQKFQLPRLEALCRRFLLIDEVSSASAAPPSPTIIPPSIFAEQMADAVDGSEFADVRFRLSDGSLVFAHKAVLAARSDFFKTIFEGSFAEKGADLISLPNLERATFIAVLRFVYTNEISHVWHDDVDVVDVLIAAGRFLLEPLKQRIEKKLEEQLEEENFSNLLQIAEAANTPKLRHACLSFSAARSEEDKTLVKAELDHFAAAVLAS